MSLTAFVVSQIAIDLESGYHLFVGDWPVHREVHSLLVATLVGAFSGTAVWFGGRAFGAPRAPIARAEFAVVPAHVGGLLGGVSHPILDGVMHPDLHPFWPFSTANPFLGIVDLGALHLLCIASGFVGLFLIGLRAGASMAAD